MKHARKLLSEPRATFSFSDATLRRALNMASTIKNNQSPWSAHNIRESVIYVDLRCLDPFYCTFTFTDRENAPFLSQPFTVTVCGPGGMVKVMST
jgi:hypothetical protein